MNETILLTGATGYIASHTWVELLDAGYQVIGLDNLCNSSATVLARIEQITAKTPKFVQGDVRDRRLLDDLFASTRISAVIHFAALKSVGESVQKPLAYYDNNLGGLVTLCAAMAHANVRQLVFSSSATVYGNPHTVPITESFPLSATNPYGQTKVMGEQVLRDLEISNAAWQIGHLRYFNPVGAHHSGLIGEDPRGIPNNLMPYVAQVAVGKREKLSIYGGDWPTPDGTGVRDYIHVVDLARGHLSALDVLRREAAALPSTWAPAGATRCSKSLRRTNARAAARCPMKLSRAAPATSPHAMPIRLWPRRCWVGAPSTASSACAKTPGAGKA